MLLAFLEFLLQGSQGVDVAKGGLLDVGVDLLDGLLRALGFAGGGTLLDLLVGAQVAHQDAAGGATARGGLGVAEDASPLACSAPLPPARVYVFLGSAALRAFAPGLKAGMGELVTSPGGRRAIVTYSPEQMVRFASSPAVQKMKALTWKSFKAAAAEASKAESSKEEGK